MFPHEDPEFDDLLLIVAEAQGLSVGLVEKDYWVTHSLWALQHTGFEIWFKGGTSLSKGFGVIQRFSEDLDLKLEPGTVSRVPAVTNWKSDGTKAKQQRQAFFEALESAITVPGASVERERNEDARWRDANYRVTYPGRHLHDLGVMKPYVLLEVGSARVTPSVERDIRSSVHNWLDENGGLGDYDPNLPTAIRCLHPHVTLVEKLEALHRRVQNGQEPATYVRHFEDVASIIEHEAALPPLEGYADVNALVEEMLAQNHIRWRPDSSDAAFNADSDAPWAEIEAAYSAITGMYWQPETRLSLTETLPIIRDWISNHLPTA